MYVGGAAFSVQRISGKFWGMSIGLGFVSLPLGFLIRLIPNALVQKLLVAIHVMKDPAKQAEIDQEERYNPAIEAVIDGLSRLDTFSRFRGGRVKGSSIALNKKNGDRRKRRTPRRDSEKKDKDKENIKSTLPSLMTMVPGLVASSIVARWQPQPSKLHDPANGDPSKSSAALWEGKLALHPDTTPEHPAWKWWHEQRETKNVSASQPS